MGDQLLQKSFEFPDGTKVCRRCSFQWPHDCKPDQLCICPHAFTWIQPPNCKLPNLNILAYLLFALQASESVGGVARHRACVLILTGVATSHEKHGLLQATVLQFAYKLMKKEAFFKLSRARVYGRICVYIILIAEAGLLINVRWVKSVTA